MKVGNAAANVFRHTATPPDLFRHTPTPPDKHIRRHTPSPGDAKSSGNLNPVDIYSQLGAVRGIGISEKLRPEDMLGYARGGVDLSVKSAPAAQNGAPLALSVRDAPTINSLIARSQRPPLSRVDSLLERLAPPPAASVIVRAQGNEHDSNEDSGDSATGKRKRKPERTVRLPAPITNITSSRVTAVTCGQEENGDARRPSPHARRKPHSDSEESMYDLAAMIADAPADLQVKREEEEGESTDPPEATDKSESGPPSPDRIVREADESTQFSSKTNEETSDAVDAPAVETAAAPRPPSLRITDSETTNVPVESPSEAKPAETETRSEKIEDSTVTGFVEVENQLEKMFANLGESVPPENGDVVEHGKRAKGRKRRKSTAPRAPRAATSTVSANGETPKKRGRRKKNVSSGVGKQKKTSAKEVVARDAYDSGSNASSGRSRGPYIQIRGPRDSPSSVSVVNTADDESERQPRANDYRGRARARGLLCSTLGTRYDATTADATWVCAFCERGPHAGAREREPGPPLGDLFGPYTITTQCEEFLALSENERRRWIGATGGEVEVWTHEECAVWAPGVVLAGARAWGLAAGVWRARGAVCGRCGRAGAGVACRVRGCMGRAHAGCALSGGWRVQEQAFVAQCPAHT